MELNVTTIKCPSCGAILQIDYDSSVICCDYCLTKIVLKDDEEIQKELRHKREMEELARQNERKLEIERSLAAEAAAERARKEEQLKSFTKKWLIISGVSILIGLIGPNPLLILGIGAFLHLYNERKKLKAEISGDICLPKLLNYTSLSCNEVKDAFQSAGFLNIKCIQSYNRQQHNENGSTQVRSIAINGKNVQTLRGYCSPNAEIRIMYDFVIKLPSLSRYKESDYGFLVEALEKAGFTNITCESLNDLVLGIMKKPGKIESISIDNNEVYSEDDDWTVSNKWYLPDAKITITYHSLNR